MKKVSTLIVILALASTIFAQQQPPNAGFETWPSSNRNPTGWSTIESAANDAGFGFFLSGKKFSSKETAAGEFVEGTASVSIQNDSLDLSALGQGSRVIPGILFLSKIIVSLTGNFGFEGVAFSGRPDVIKFAYKYKPNGVDTANFFVALSKFNTAADSSEALAIAGESLPETSGSNWDTLSLPIDYDPLYVGQNPDTLTIGFFAGGQAGQKGSKLWVDNVRFVYTNPSGVVEVPVETPTVVVFPNPANSVVNFKTDFSLENTVATFYSLEGKQVVEKSINSNFVEVNELASGRYFFTLHRDGKAVGVGNFSLVK